MAKPIEQKPIEKMCFEEAMKELETIVRDLEKGATPLEESIAAYERGALLKKHCEKCLSDARNRVEEITLNADGTSTAKPVEFS